MRPILGLALLFVSTVVAQNNQNPPTNQPSSQPANQNTKAGDLPQLSTIGQPQGPTTTPAPEETSTQETPSSAAASSETPSTFSITSAPPASSVAPTKSDSDPATQLSAFHLTDLPTLAGVGIPNVMVPDTAHAPYMQKSNLPDGTVFIWVGAALGFFGVCILAWRGLVAWSLHRSVKRAAMQQNVSDMKAMSALPVKKRGLYNVVGASSNMSLDRLSAAPMSTSRPAKPFATTGGTGTPPRATSSLFFSPTAGGTTGLRDSVANRSSHYLPAGYYPTSNAQAGSGSPVAHLGGGTHLSTYSLQAPGNRYSARSGISPPVSPSLPPSRGYDRAPPSRDGLSVYRNSVVTPGTPGTSRGLYGQEHGNPSQLSLNVPGGSTTPGGRAPSAYLEDLFENHNNGSKERF